MIWQRLLTAVILLPLFLLLLFKADIIIFQIVTTLLILWAAVEWSALIGLSKFFHRFVYVFLIFLIVLAIVLVAEYFSTTELDLAIILGFTIIWWIIAAVLVFSYPKLGNCWGRGFLVRGIMGILVLVPTWLTLNLLQIYSGPVAVLYLFLLIWVADSGAWLVGKLFGKHKLIPAVSPGKTWEGFFGALLLVLPLIIAELWYSQTETPFWVWSIVFSLVTVLFSILGDLFESMLKRQAGVKDSGNLLPGHGGLLDRIDSLTAAAPVFLAGLILLNKFAS